MVKTVELTSDEFYIRVSNKTLAYKVDDVRTVLPEDVSSLSIGIRAAFLVVPGVVAAIRRSTAKRDRSREPAVKNLREKQGVSARKLTNRKSIKVQTDSNPNDAA